MICTGCGNKRASRGSWSLGGAMTCDACGSASSFKFSDVYFRKPGFEPHLADPEKSPKGTFVRSREHKAMLMKTLGVREVGDKVHGARDQY
jgi:hypothetical protein